MILFLCGLLFQVGALYLAGLAGAAYSLYKTMEPPPPDAQTMTIFMIFLATLCQIMSWLMISIQVYSPT